MQLQLRAVHETESACLNGIAQSKAKASAPKATKASSGAGASSGAAAYEEALMVKRIEALRRLKDQFADPGSLASQSVAAYSDLLDGASRGFISRFGLFPSGHMLYY